MCTAKVLAIHLDSSSPLDVNAMSVVPENEDPDQMVMVVLLSTCMVDFSVTLVILNVATSLTAKPPACGKISIT